MVSHVMNPPTNVSPQLCLNIVSVFPQTCRVSVVQLSDLHSLGLGESSSTRIRVPGYHLHVRSVFICVLGPL